MNTFRRLRIPGSVLQISCGTVALIALLVAVTAVFIVGFFIYNAVDTQAKRLQQQLDRAQDQLDRVLDNNEQALGMYEELIVDFDDNHRVVKEQLDQAIQRNEEALKIYAELLAGARSAIPEAEKLPSDLRDFRVEVARLAVETARLNNEIQLVQGDVRTLGREITGVAQDIENIRRILEQVVTAPLGQ